MTKSENNIVNLLLSPSKENVLLAILLAKRRTAASKKAIIHNFFIRIKEIHDSKKDHAGLWFILRYKDNIYSINYCTDPNNINYKNTLVEFSFTIQIKKVKPLFKSDIAKYVEKIINICIDKLFLTYEWDEQHFIKFGKAEKKFFHVMEKLIK